MRGDMLLHRRWYVSVLVAACKQLGDRRDGPMSHKQLVEHMPDPDLDWESLSQLGLDDVEVFNVLNQISSTYYHALFFEEAERIALQAVELSRKVFRAGDLRLLDCNENLAAAYWMRGNRLDSEKLQLDVVRSRQVVLGVAHPDTQRAMQALSHYYFWWHEWSKAHDLRKQLVAVNKDAHGESDRRTLIAMHSLARLYRDTGEFAQAEGVQTELLALEQAAFGEDDERTMRTTANLVAIHRERGQYEEALALQTKIVADRERILGTEHEQTVRSVAELATLHRSQGQYDKAQMLQLRVVTTMVKTHGQESDATMLQMAELAVVYMLNGKREMAQEIVAEIVSAHRETTPDEQKPSRRVIRELAETYLDQYMYKEAAILLEHTDLMIKASFGEDVETDLNSTGLLARAYMFSDRWKEAEDVLLTAWDGRHESAHDHWEYKLHILLGLHTLYKTHGPLIKAEMPLLELLGPIDQAEPLQNIGKEGWLKELVDIYMGERRWKDADGMLNTLMGIRIARYGQTDVRTQESMRDLVIVKWKQRKWREAARLTCRHYWRYKFVKPRAIMILLTLLWICMVIILWFAPKGTIGALLILQALFVPPLSVLVGEVIGGIILIVSY
ncbi:hypothetical protein SLS60_011766 [Paraconiothyrium brasiliense]|uniref:Tetratricopeptide repeat protein n=1 Tax=Paraconiothyrium brasiliense TaxID=300254 RepID=A0ABR3QHZ3_9PLEO